MKKNIGIIGFGNMGQAIAGQIKNNYQVNCFDKDASKLSKSSGFKIIPSIVDVVKQSEVVILAVKPQDFKELLAEIKPACSLDKLMISIAAGITIDYIERSLGMVRLVRVMPNLPAKIGAGMTCISKNKIATEEDFDCAEELFDYLGETIRIREELLNAATAISGSGPAYVCNFLQLNSFRPDNVTQEKKEEFLALFQSAAQGIGFSQDEAKLLVETTLYGTLEFLKQSKISPEELIKQVTSKGGTTEAAFKIFNQGGSLGDAILAAKKRAEELSKEANQ